MAEDGKVQNSVKFDINQPENVAISIMPEVEMRSDTHCSGYRSRFPSMFERASGSWWNPKFDSAALEKQLSVSVFPLIQKRFQYALFYIIISCVVWSIFYAASITTHWVGFVVANILLILINTLILVLTYTTFYHKYYLIISISLSLLLCALCLSTFSVAYNSNISPIGAFCICIEIIIMMYTVIPMPLFMCVLIGILFSMTFEILAHTVYIEEYDWSNVVGKIFLHMCTHLVGVHMFIMMQVRNRNTFLKVAQSIMSRRDLENEKQLKEKMLNSLMPEYVWRNVLLNENRESQTNANMMLKIGASSEFRQNFTMDLMDNVSILYADIVGFTKMSAPLSAEKLVSLLNDLFGRFDNLCSKCGCEKICTLGDCYYCVSGCPTPKPDHAKCCIEMGLGMVECIRQFDEDNNEEVDMRVGIHTGMVLCGVIGKKRFKFDVWSHDVTLANDLEASGKPGRVHISETTYQFVKEDYEVEPGENIEDLRTNKTLVEKYDTESSTFGIKHVEDVKEIKTYFIVGRSKSPRSDVTSSATESDTEDNHLVREDGEQSNGIHEGAHNRKPSLRTQILTNYPDNQRPGSSNGIAQRGLLTSRRSSGFFAMSEVSVEDGSDNIDNHCEQGTIPLQQQENREQRDLLSSSRSRQEREEKDRQLISVIQQNVKNKEYFYKPPINPCTLEFKSVDIEQKYRGHFCETEDTKVRTFSAPRFNSFFDTIFSFLFFISLSVSCFVVFKAHIPWLVVFSLCTVFQLFIVVPQLRDVLLENVSSMETTLRKLFSRWYLRQILGAIIVSLPTVAIYSNFYCPFLRGQSPLDVMYCYLFVVSLLNFCNLTMLSSWMKSILAIVLGIILLILMASITCHNDNSNATILNYNLNFTTYNLSGNSTKSVTSPISVTKSSHISEGSIFSDYSRISYELILDIILLLLLIMFLNREFEASYRLEFHGDIKTADDKAKMEIEKEQADWLLNNIVPKQVSEVLKRTNKYSENHQAAGVIFASIVNFNELFEENFEGGKQYMRCLNECFCDFEDLFDWPKFKDVEKIKTIGSCIMAASGLNKQSRQKNKHEFAHLFALMDFCIELLEVVKKFNKDMINYNFDLKIGFNYGDVTSGVIGTTKLFYDIWGDTVNISSRMYSTGEHNRIQVTQKSKDALEDYFDFEPIGSKVVKGLPKPIPVYLVTGRKVGVSWTEHLPDDCP